MPYNHSLHSRWEVGVIFIPSPFLIPYIKLCCHSKWGTGRRVGSAGSSETHLISRMENEMFRGVLTNCCISCNRMRSCEQLLQEERGGRCRACSLPVFYRRNKRRRIQLISFCTTDKTHHICWSLRLKEPGSLLCPSQTCSPRLHESALGEPYHINLCVQKVSRRVDKLGIRVGCCWWCRLGEADALLVTSGSCLSQQGSSQSSEQPHLLSVSAPLLHVLFY